MEEKLANYYNVVKQRFLLQVEERSNYYKLHHKIHGNSENDRLYWKWVNTYEVANILNVTNATALKYLKQLESKGHLVCLRYQGWGLRWALKECEGFTAKYNDYFIKNEL